MAVSAPLFFIMPARLVLRKGYNVKPAFNIIRIMEKNRALCRKDLN